VFSGSSKTPQPPENGEHLAGFWIRVAALIIDLFVLLLVAMLLSRWSGIVFARLSREMLHIGQPGTFWKGPVAFLLGFVGNLFFGLPFAAIVCSLPEAVFGMGPGKMITGVRIVSEPGRGAARARLVGRALFKNLGAWGIVIAQVARAESFAAVAIAVGALVALGTLAAAGPAKRTLYDFAAGTLVVYLRDRRDHGIG
jgi:uncharacterized RDD family membrane protein YckC